MYRIPSIAALVLAFGIVLPHLAFSQEKTGTTPAMQTPASSTAPAAKPRSSGKHMTTLRVDLNTASRDELIKLPGIDGATADKIVEARPFKSKSELRSKNLVSKAEYGKIASHVFAKSAMAAGK